MKYPDGFIWGVASSAIQIEGYPREDGGGESVWEKFCTRPGSIAGDDDISIATDSYHRYEEDISLIAEMGVKNYRFSTSWARIDPFGDGNWNEKGLEYYDRVVNCCLENGIEPWVTLHHWELPQALEDRGGWRVLETAQAFARFAGMMAQRFKGRVQRYFTINEMQCVLQLGYKFGIHAPGCKLDLEGQFACYKSFLLANGYAQRAVKAADENAQVGFASTGRLCYPETNSPEDMEAARRASFRLFDDDWIFTHSMSMDPICRGELHPEPGSQLEQLARQITPEEWKIIHCPPDFVGVNVYNGAEVRATADGGEEYVPRYTGYPKTALKWPVTERVMNEGILHLWRRYGIPLYITENGLSCNDKIYLDGKVHDADRIDFLTRYLRQLQIGMEEADVRGYFHWSLADNFEWHSGYGDRFGLVYIDYPSQRRIMKDSALWYKGVVASNGESLT
ncbi:MAG: glycosyl hydrolase family protein [Clostridiales bacterium]|nr:glycosyl hydrolase family protein [Clostridiales bacterium]